MKTRRAAMTDYQREITRIVGESVQRFNAQLDELVAAMPVGSTLCVHDEPSSGDFAPDRDVSTFTIRAKAHVLPPDEACDAIERRTQYGPKTGLERP